jgi:hypothetical protein
MVSEDFSWKDGLVVEVTERESERDVARTAWVEASVVVDDGVLPRAEHRL